MTPRVTVAVVSWNTRELLGQCLDSLAPSVEAGDAEVWVVDNASSDGSGDMVRKCFPWATLVEPGENLGFGSAVNRVAAETQSEWIAAANADIELRPDALLTMIDAGDATPDTAVIAPRLITQSGSTQHSIHPFPTVRLSLIVNAGLHKLPIGLGDRLAIEGCAGYDRARAVDWAHGAFLLVRRRAFDEVGGFDPGQWMYAEDIDLQWRLARAGWRVRFEPRAQALHAVSAATSKGFGERRRQLYLDATFAWLVRRRGVLVAWAFAAINAFGSALRAAALKAPESASPNRYRARRARAALDARLYARGLRRRATLLRAADGPAAAPDR
jgi:GT2 family glycosyltransferase